MIIVISVIRALVFFVSCRITGHPSSVSANFFSVHRTICFASCHKRSTLCMSASVLLSTVKAREGQAVSRGRGWLLLLPFAVGGWMMVLMWNVGQMGLAEKTTDLSPLPLCPELCLGRTDLKFASIKCRLWETDCTDGSL